MYEEERERVDVAIFHNMLWAKYKGGVFSALYGLTAGSDLRVSFTQIAETEGDRVSLSQVDLSYHTYPYELLFTGNYSGVSAWKRSCALVTRAWRTKAHVVVMPGYERVEFWAMLFTLMLRRKPRAVFCDSTARDNPGHLLKTWAKRFFFARCDGFFCYGLRSREYLMMNGVPDRKIFFRCQAAALPHDYDEKAAVEARITHGPRPDTSPRYLYVGRLSQEKGLDTLLDAMRRVVELQPGARLKLIGAGPLQPILQQRAASLGVADNVEFPGSMSMEKLSREFASATALVLPSISEPWGLVVNEALSYGCPVIVSDACGCVPEMVVNGNTGLVFSAGDAAALGSAMVQAKETFCDVSEAAERCVVHMRSFTPVKAAQQIVKGAAQLLAQSGAVQ